MVRYVPYGRPNEHFIMALSGETRMKIAGRTEEMWADVSEAIRKDDRLLTSLAGNMFSGYAIGPVLMVVLSLAGAADMSRPQQDSLFGITRPADADIVTDFDEESNASFDASPETQS